MAGRGEVEALDREPIPRVYTLNKDLAWVPAIDPLHSDKPTAGVGLGRSFAKRLIKEDPAALIGLIPSAFGGTSLEEWAPDGKLFTDAVKRTRAAMQAGKLRGILWHQGEADSGKEALARSYRERWIRTIDALRKELGAPAVPVAVGELGEFFAGAYAPGVNEQLASIPLADPYTAFVSSARLNSKSDRVHFDSPSLREFGRRYALAFLSLDPAWGAAR